MEDFLEPAIATARKAGALLLPYFERRVRVEYKGEVDLVTEADRASEALILEELRKHFPQHAVVAEESGSHAGDSGYRWYVDPLDGTTNFLHGIPLFCISIGLEREGQLVAGVIYNPASDELFTAEKGKGAFLNDRRRLRVAARKTLADAVVATGIPHRGRPGHPGFMRELETVMREVAGIRRTGSAALDLAWTAAGRFDGYWERNLKPWDLAAGLVILRESGGIANDINGGEKMLETGDVLAGNGAIVKSITTLLAGTPAQA